jgi:branched-chain amino acid transport system ATP-binding protein
LSPLYVKEAVAVLAQFRAEEPALLIAEQNVKFLGLADRVYTLDNGRIGFSAASPPCKRTMRCAAPISD